MWRRLVVSLSASLALNGLAAFAAYSDTAPEPLSGAGELFLMPGEATSIFVGGNMISGPYWTWVLMNTLILWAFLLMLLALRTKASQPAGKPKAL